MANKPKHSGRAKVVQSPRRVNKMAMELAGAMQLAETVCKTAIRAVQAVLHDQGKDHRGKWSGQVIRDNLEHDGRWVIRCVRDNEPYLVELDDDLKHFTIFERIEDGTLIED